MAAILSNHFHERAWIFLLRKGESRDEEFDTIEDLLDDVAIPGIRCPICKWRPTRGNCWECWDCDYPEYFYDGCGTAWNTFETRGRCPTCAHQWVWTSCLSCWGWSLHEDWYENEK